MLRYDSCMSAHGNDWYEIFRRHIFVFVVVPKSFLVSLSHPLIDNVEIES